MIVTSFPRAVPTVSPSTAKIHWYRWSGGSSMASRFTLSTLLRCLYLSKAKDPPAAFASNIIESWLQDTAKPERSSKNFGLFGLFGLVRNLTNDQSIAIT